MKKRLLSILMALALCLGLLPTAALATSTPDSYVFDIAEGTIRILDGSTEGKIKVAYGNGQTTGDFDPSQEITVTGSFIADNKQGKSLKVETNLPVTVRIKNLTIDNDKADFYQAMALFGNATGKADVTLILEGTSLLVGGQECGGIEVEEGHTLTIKGDGALTAKGGEYSVYYNGAGIGGHGNTNCGTVIIESGTVTAIGRLGAADIGVGSGYKGAGGILIITGGTVTYNNSTATAGIKPVGNNLEVYGNLTLPVDLTIPEGKTLTIPSDTSLTIPSDTSLTVPEGVTLTIAEGGTLTNNGKIYAEVSSETQLRSAVDLGATSIKLMADIKISGTLELKNKEITLDLNGCVLESKDSVKVIKLEDGNSQDNTSLTLIDSQPAATHEGLQYKGGVINDSIEVTASGGGSNNCCLYANGGSVTGNVGLSSVNASIRCTSNTPTVFYANVGRVGNIYGGIFRGTYTKGNIYGGIFYGLSINNDSEVIRYTYGGIFYGNNVIGRIAGKTVTFKYNDSTYAREIVSDNAVNKTAVAPIPPKVDDTENPATAGYHINWYKDNATVSYDFSTPVDKDITLKAKWENTYRITYNTAGGTPIAPTMQVYNTEVTAPEAPTKTGYTFNGWNPATVPMEDTTVTAQWTPNTYDITYKGMDGAEFGENHPTTHTYDTATVIPTPTKTGYTFVGWLVNGEGTPVKDLTLGATDYMADITLTAVWDHYTVTLNTNGGTILEGNVTQYTYGTGAKLPDKVFRSGYSFAGWYDNEACRGKPVAEITTTDIGEKTFYAAWTYIPHTYPPIVNQPENGSVTVSPKAPKKGDTVTITPTPDKGYEVDKVIVTDHSGNPVEVKDNGDGTYSFTQPAGKVTISVTFAEIQQPGGNPFVDVPVDAYYYNAVLWAAKNGITGGVDDTHFAPNAPCTRAQSVTFLWRAAGSPAPQSRVMPFTDVAAGSYYYDAVLWAVENGITKGTSGTTFSPDATCSRGQIVTFLWRSQNSPAAGSVNPFADVKADDYYADAVLWAVKENVTNGTSDTTFSPADDCTRAQIVTFLWRALDQ